MEIMNYTENLTKQFVERIAKVTGIKEDKLMEIAKENGVNFILEHPAACGLTKKQVEKLTELKELIHTYSEAVFLKEDTMLDSSKKVGELFVRRLMNRRDKERFEIAFLDAQNRLIAIKTVFEGVVNEAPVYPRRVVQEALNHDANSVILAHNHPGGSLNPSGSDIEATKRIKSVLEGMGIKVMDHIIVGDNKYTSFAEKGLI